jgi:methionyl-tRNA formyltransferase
MHNSLDGLSRKSIARAQKVVENFRSWEDALTHAKGRIKELKQAVRIFEQKIKAGEPWPGAGVQELDRKRQANG